MTVAEAQLAAYVAEVVDAVEAFGGTHAVGVYVLGSALLGGFDSDTSDLDLVVVVAGPLERLERAAIVRELDKLPPPLRKLELVVYAEGAKPPAYELNYPDGEAEPPPPRHTGSCSTRPSRRSGRGRSGDGRGARCSSRSRRRRRDARPRSRSRGRRSNVWTTSSPS